MLKKRALYIVSTAMGDHILSIPFLLKLKKEGYYITLLKYHPKYFGSKTWASLDDVSDFLYTNHLFDEILFIPHNKLKLLFFIGGNLLRFDIVYAPTKTFFSRFWAKLFGKKQLYVFRSINDKGPYIGLVQGLLKDNSIDSLFAYRKLLHIPKDISYAKKYGIHGKFVTIFPSIFERSIDAREWSKIISFLEQKDLTIIFIGGKRENRLYEDLQSYYHKNIINLCGKTNFKEVMNILSDSQVNISANGGIMWFGHLLNKYNISLHITSGYITEPPVDNIHSFNIRKYTYPCCKPCEPLYYRFNGKKGIPSCVFAGTNREAECKKSITGEDIIFYLKNILN